MVKVVQAGGGGHQRIPPSFYKDERPSSPCARRELDWRIPGGGRRRSLISNCGSTFYVLLLSGKTPLLRYYVPVVHCCSESELSRWYWFLAQSVGVRGRWRGLMGFQWIEITTVTTGYRLHIAMADEILKPCRCCIDVLV